MYRSLLENIEAQLWQKVDEINQDFRMGIADLKEQLAHLPDIKSLTMRYGEAGTQIFKIGETEVELPATASTTDIEAALVNPFEFAKKKLQQPAVTA